jgi:hypothetical protein
MVKHLFGLQFIKHEKAIHAWMKKLGKIDASAFEVDLYVHLIAVLSEPT